MAHRVEQHGVRGHYPPVQNEEGIALHKPVILVLSIIASIVAYKNVSEKNRKPIAGVILGAGLSYSVGLCKILQSVASILEKNDGEDKSPRDLPPPAGRQYPLPNQPQYHPGQRFDSAGNPIDESGNEMKMPAGRPHMKGNPHGSQQQHDHSLDRPQQKQPWE